MVIVEKEDEKRMLFLAPPAPALEQMYIYPQQHLEKNKNNIKY